MTTPVMLYPTPVHRQLPLREQPAFRVAANPGSCSLTELLAVLVGGKDQIEIAQTLITQYGSLRRLASAHPKELARIPGVSQGTALRLKAALTLAGRVLQPEDARPQISSPAAGAAVLMPLLNHLEQEYLYSLSLDTRNCLLSADEIYHGSLNTAMVRTGELFKVAIRQNAASILIAHNHPSGDPSPSPEDVEMTRVAQAAGKLLDIALLDHLVIAGGKYVSLKERGLIS